MPIRNYWYLLWKSLELTCILLTFCVKNETGYVQSRVIGVIVRVLSLKNNLFSRKKRKKRNKPVKNYLKLTIETIL